VSTRTPCCVLCGCFETRDCSSSGAGPIEASEPRSSLIPGFGDATIGAYLQTGEKRGFTMRQIVLLVLLAAVLALPAVATADPNGPNVQPSLTIQCSNGESYLMNGGTTTNRSHEAFAVNSTSIFVSQSFVFTVNGENFVAYDDAFGLKNLITCTGDFGGGVTFTTTGFLTPRK
jgi:hypothetical protein